MATNSNSAAETPDVVAVGDDLDLIDDRLVAGDVADADVDDRRDRHDTEEHERGDLLAPRSADPEGTAHRRLEQAQTSPPRAAPAHPRTGDSRGRRPRRGGLGVDECSRLCAPGSAEEDLVERRQPRRQSIQREAELGNDVAHGIEVVVAVDRDLDEALVGDCRQSPAQPGRRRGRRARDRRRR